MLLAASLLPVGIAGACESTHDGLLAKMDSYHGRIDIKAADKEIHVYLDSDRIDHGYPFKLDMMFVLQCYCAPTPWSDMTLNDAVLSANGREVVIVSSADRMVVVLCLSDEDCLIQQEFFHEYTFVRYTGYGLARNVRPAVKF
ncbi:hypothetical protein GGQ74_000206 [Desulfobaculum xiamenense]|uniref:Uncharacterized protein n=1 Tax=Desulfobaculum xiamenense TaxID=995050 RepID=A0A846QCX0_9BACT|nr:hypothetical protein [Desulfobaculum xiamenense]NJB66566.1 hypothetical protein [Desulfobaculum xiamenense]